MSVGAKTVADALFAVAEGQQGYFTSKQATNAGYQLGSQAHHVKSGNWTRVERRVSICRGYLAGNRETVSFVPGAGSEAGCVRAAGDYAFTGGWKARANVWVNRLSDGTEVGTFDPGPTLGGVANTGWIDLLTGINAFQRSTGEYLVFVEENYKAKSLIYRWKS